MSNQIKRVRERKGYSQERLAEEAGVSLRTVQRVENGENKPQGETLKRLTQALDVSMDEIMEWKKEEDTTYLSVVNFTALTFILFPLLGILIPLILWITKKDKIRDLNEVGRDLLNFQITWCIGLFGGLFWTIFSINQNLSQAGDISPSLITEAYLSFIVFIAVLYGYNLLIVILNSILIAKNKSVWYYPRINFIR